MKNLRHMPNPRSVATFFIASVYHHNYLQFNYHFNKLQVLLQTFECTQGEFERLLA